MKKFIFIHGPNGVGKSTLCEALHKELNSSAWLESEWCRNINPFIFNSEIEIVTEKNMSYILRSYLECSLVDYVIFDWGYHGPRKRIFEKVMENLSDIEFEYIPITITCSEEENLKRMKLDNRSEDRIQRALQIREIYNNTNNITIDTTEMTVDEIVAKVKSILK